MMKVISCFNQIVDGVISSITYTVEDNGNVVQEATVEIVDNGQKAVLKSNKIFCSDEEIIKRSFLAIFELLKKQDVQGLYAASNTGEFTPIAM